VGLTYAPKYKWVTWGAKLGLNHFTFYPIYDWSYQDVWKAILDNKWSYNAIYDAQFRYGITIPHMRVSNVHHETAINALWYMQEVEPETYDKLTKRLSGVDMASKMGKVDYFPTELPFMFKDWKEYRDYLLEKLITNPDWKRNFNIWFKRHDSAFGEQLGKVKYMSHIRAILLNDFEGTTLGNLLTGHQAAMAKKRHLEESTC
jgi:predicted phosphoadenosine phosphosulfate sulfurtransferase